MTGFLLDTNIPSELTRNVPSAKITEWFDSHDDATLHLSVITIGELRRGCTIHPDPQRRIRLTEWLEGSVIPMFGDRIHPITRAIADRWGVLDGQQKVLGKQVGMADGLIAATALELDLVVLTRNVDHFERLGVPLINPWSA